MTTIFIETFLRVLGVALGVVVGFIVLSSFLLAVNAIIKPKK